MKTKMQTWAVWMASQGGEYRKTKARYLDEAAARDEAKRVREAGKCAKVKQD
jgi:hypothetical protein